MTDPSSPRTGPQHWTSSNSLRVLLVGNFPESFSRTMSLHADHEKIEVKCASDGTEAIHLLNKEEFDLVLTELKKPATSGRALLDWMSQHPSSMLLCLTTSDVREEGSWAEIGPYLDDFLNKRSAIREVADRIKKTQL